MKRAATWLLNAVGPLRAQQVAGAYRSCLGGTDANTRLVLADLAAYCRIGQSSFVAGDPHQTAFNEGARDVFLHIAEMCRLSPSAFPELLEDEDR